MKKFIAGLIVAACVLALVGCGTLNGAGQDIAGAGHSIQKAANR